MIFELDFRMNDVGGPVTPGRLSVTSGGRVSSGEEAEAMLRAQPRALFLVHGFNVDRKSGREHLSAFAERLSDWPDAIVKVLWPGDHAVKALSYPWEGEDADDTARRLDDFITRVMQSGASLSFVSHSLGARVVLETIHRLPPTFRIDQLSLLAPAVDDDCLSRDGRYYEKVSQRTQRVVALSSIYDRVLRFAYPVGDLLQAFMYFWKDEPGKPMGLHGPQPQSRQPPNVVSEATHPQPEPVESRRVDHGDYLPEAHPNAKQLAAVKFSDDVIDRVTPLHYVLP